MKIISISKDDFIRHRIPALGEKEIHTYILPIHESSLLRDAQGCLCADEQKHMSSLRMEKDRQRFLAAHSFLRRILSVYTGISPHEISFSKGKHGKPFLESASVHFNLSHAGDYAALSFSKNTPIGIDLEICRENVNISSLVRRFFHPEEWELFCALAPDRQADFFFSRWTVREAFLKGIGDGLTMSPSSFYVAADLHSDSHTNCHYRIQKSQEDYSSWHIDPVHAPAGYFCSVAYCIG